MNNTYTLTEAQRQLPKLVREAGEGDASTVITVHGEPRAYLLSRNRMEAIVETLEIMGNPRAMKAIQDYEDGSAEFIDFEDV